MLARRICICPAEVVVHKASSTQVTAWCKLLRSFLLLPALGFPGQIKPGPRRLQHCLSDATPDGDNEEPETHQSAQTTPRKIRGCLNLDSWTRLCFQVKSTPGRTLINRQAYIEAFKVQLFVFLYKLAFILGISLHETQKKTNLPLYCSVIAI